MISFFFIFISSTFGWSLYSSILARSKYPPVLSLYILSPDSFLNLDWSNANPWISSWKILTVFSGIEIKKLKLTNPNYINDLSKGLHKWETKLKLNERSLHLTDEGIPFLDSILIDLFID